MKNRAAAFFKRGCFVFLLYAAMTAFFPALPAYSFTPPAHGRFTHEYYSLQNDGNVFFIRENYRNGKLINKESKPVLGRDREILLKKYNRQQKIYEKGRQKEEKKLQQNTALKKETEKIKKEKIQQAKRHKPQRTLYSAQGNKIAEYSFDDIRGKRIQLTYSIPEDEYAENVSGFGYTDEDLNKICLQGQQQKKKKTKKRRNMAVYRQEITFSRSDCEEAGKAYLKERGFVLNSKEKTVYPDMPGLVRRNEKAVKEISAQLFGITAARKYTQRETLATLLLFVQGAVEYKAVPVSEKGVITGGIYPAAMTLSEGKGDCDTKSLLAAAMTAEAGNISVIGISINEGKRGHYFLGVETDKKQSDETLVFQDREYVLMDPAGPGLLPLGTISENSRVAIKSGKYKAELLR